MSTQNISASADYWALASRVFSFTGSLLLGYLLVTYYGFDLQTAGHIAGIIAGFSMAGIVICMVIADFCADLFHLMTK